MIRECAPQVAPSTMQAIIRTESGFNPLAININGGAKLARKPRTLHEAAAWSHWLISRGYSVDMGLMQINSNNLRRLGLNAASVFDPCRNLAAGARILTESYRRALREGGTPQSALLKALSAYNTGNFERGFRNGYVAKVVKHRQPVPLNRIEESDAPPLILADADRRPPSEKKRKSGAG